MNEQFPNWIGSSSSPARHIWWWWVPGQSVLCLVVLTLLRKIQYGMFKCPGFNSRSTHVLVIDLQYWYDLATQNLFVFEWEYISWIINSRLVHMPWLTALVALFKKVTSLVLLWLYFSTEIISKTTIYIYIYIWISVDEIQTLICP